MRLTIVFVFTALIGLGIWNFPFWEANEPEQTILLQDGREFDKHQLDYLITKFTKAGIKNIQMHNNRIKVPARFRSQCNQIINSDEFVANSKDASSATKPLSNPFIAPSERARLAKGQKIEQIEGILERIADIEEAVIFHDQQKNSDFRRDLMQTAAITLWAKEGKTIGPQHADTARQILCNAFAGLEYPNVLVVDGDTGSTFSINNDSGNNPESPSDSVDLDTTLGKLEIQSRELLSRFGRPEVKLQMVLEKRVTEPAPPAQNLESGNEAPSSIAEVVPNGSGSVRVSPMKEEHQPNKSTPTSVTVKKLQRINVSLKQQAIEEYTRQRLATSESISDDQLARGLVAMRNEITTELISWLRNRVDIELGSNLVSVEVIPAPQPPAVIAQAKSDPWYSNLVIPVLTACGLVIAAILVFTTKKQRIGHYQTGRYSESFSSRLGDENRSEMNREPTVRNAGFSELNTESSTTTAMQNLVAGEGK